MNDAARPAAAPAGSAVETLRDHLAATGCPTAPSATTSWHADVRELGLPAALAAPPPPLGAAEVLAVRVYAGTVIVGPLHHADGSSRPCGECLDRRWLAARPLEERKAIDSGLDAFAAGRNPLMSPFALEMIGSLVTAATGPGRTAATGGVADIVVADLADLTVTRRQLVADSECASCARPRADTAAGAVVTLAPRPKRSADDHRLRSASDFPLPVDGYTNPVTGALTSALLPAYHCTATSPVSGFFRVRSRFDYHEMWWSGQTPSLASSERHGLLEGLERYAGQFPRAKRADVFGAYRDLAADALDPRACGEYGPEFYTGHQEFYAPFTEDTPMHWTWGYSLRDRRPILVPEQMAFYLDRRPYRKFVQECSNGCASGSCLEEAVFHGLLELIERDAFLLSWYGGARLPEIDARDLADPQTQFMIDRVAREGYRIRLFDMRADLPIPAVAAVAERRDGELGTLVFGAGAGFAPIEAIRSATAETASYVTGFDERVASRLPDLTAMVDDHNLVHELSHHSGLYGLPQMAAHAGFLFDDPPLRGVDALYDGWLKERPDGLDLADDVRYLVDRVAALGSDVIVVDQTCPEQEPAGITTVSVIAPGLIPIDFGWQRQRALRHPRLRDFLAGRLQPIHPAADGLGPRGLNARPHPFP